MKTIQTYWWSGFLFVCAGLLLAGMSDNSWFAMDVEAKKQTSTTQPTSRPVKVATSRPTSRPVLADELKPPQKGDEKEDCDTGCGAVKPSTIPKLTRQMYDTYMAKYAKEALVAGSPGLEGLLFYGYKTRKWLEKTPPKRLSAERLAFLKQELSRDHVRIGLRIVNKKGENRVYIAPKRVPIHGHYTLYADKHPGIPQPSFGGKLKRVGLYHIWVRI